MMDQPLLSFKLERTVRKVYIWHVSEKQLDNAIAALIHRIYSLAGIMHEALVKSILLNTISEKEADYT